VSRIDTRKGDRHRQGYYAEYEKRRPSRTGYIAPSRIQARELGLHRMTHQTIVAIDGEGQTRKGKHLYTYMAAVDEHGEVLHTKENPEGLTTKQCLEFFLTLAASGVKRAFGYSLGYDYSMMLRDIPDAKLYALFHEEARTYTDDAGKKRVRGVFWAGYKLNLLNRRLTICRSTYDPITRKTKRMGPTITVWDVFRFYACRFTQALLDWKVADEKTLEFMTKMKAERSNFDRLDSAEVKRYCQQECMYLAQLVRKLIQATESEVVDVRLRDFYGAGSLAGALLRKIKVTEYVSAPPPEMNRAIAQAFFGGRFEITHVGPIQGAVHNYDISSAYPYQCTALPCLLHGQWELAHGRNLRRHIEHSRLALVRYRLPRDRAWSLALGGKSGRIHILRKLTSKTPAFGPFPFRLPTGDILFPLASEGGYVWKDEYLAAERNFPNVKAAHAWVYNTDCDCRPFKDIPLLYAERLRIGKEGPGIVLKLMLNSIYGKLAQHKGSARYQSYVYAGNITSGTRAMLLNAMGRARNRWSVLMLATDGIFTRERLDLPKPDDTGTEGTGKPLGGWEHKEAPNGIFLVRPGIFFPLDMSVDADKLKARGIQRKVLHENRQAIMAHYEAGKIHEPLALTRPIFVGLKSALTKSKAGVARSDRACSWDQAARMNISMHPMPKRERVEGQQLLPWPWIPGESSPYNPAVIGPESASIKAEQALQEDQPDIPLENI